MNLTIYKKELNRNKRTFLIWLTIIILTDVFILSFFSSMEQMGDTMNEMMKGLPEGMLKAFNMDFTSFTTPLGYYATYFGMHILIMMGAFSAGLASNILSKEERDGTADFLLTRPVTRSQVISSKMLAYLTYVLIVFALIVVVGWFGLKAVSDTPFSSEHFWVMTIYGLFITLSFGAIAWLVSVFPKRGKSTSGIIYGVVVGSFVLSALSKIDEKSEFIAKLTPFGYSDFVVSNPDYSLDMLNILVLSLSIILGHSMVYIMYRRKDIL